MRTFIFLTTLFITLTAASAAAQIDVEFDEEERNHLSVFVGGSHVDAADETVFTLGLDYEYRLTELIGIGGVVEQTFGEIDATTLLAVADIHLWKGLALQVGPGIEFVDNETFAIGRIGALYEIEVGDSLTLSPQFHYDISSGEDTFVFGIAIGKAF